MTSALSSPEPRRKMTLEEWAALGEDEPGEIVDDILVEDEAPSAIHAVVVAWLALVLGAWARAHGALVLGSGLKLEVAPRRGRMPDLVVYLAGARRPAPRGLVSAPPSIAVEVVSDSPRDERRDRIEKLSEYAAAGIGWYWLVDPELRSFEILERGPDGRYVHALAVTDGAIESLPGCEGLHVDVSGLWAQIDALMASDHE